jgi:hypothetical protein
MISRALTIAVSLLLFSNIALAQSWEFIAPMKESRADPYALALNDGRVLLMGGIDDNGKVLNSCEIYDPKSDTWTYTGSMKEARQRFPACILPDGRVVVLGGLTGVDNGSTVPTSNGCEIYDPKSGVWSSLPTVPERVESMPILVLPNGKIFISGGLDGSTGVTSNLAFLLDPNTGKYQKLASMPSAVWAQIVFYDSIHGQVLLQGGGFGGLNGGYPSITQVYDIATDTWHLGPSASVEHNAADFVRMPEGSLYCLGGRPGAYTATDLVEGLAPPYTKWSILGHLTSPRWLGHSVLLTSDSILYIGGNNNPGVNTNVFDSTNWFNYRSGIASPGPRLHNARSGFGIVSLHSPDSQNSCRHFSNVYVFGGMSTSRRVLNTCETLELNSRNQGISCRMPQMVSGETGLCGGLDTLIEIQNISCDTLMVDSIQLSRSPSFVIDSSSFRVLPGAVGTLHLTFIPTSLGVQSAVLRFRATSGSFFKDTSIQIHIIVSNTGFKNAAQHYSTSATTVNRPDSLLLIVDIDDSVHLNSLWPTVRTISATYSWDTSVASFAGFVPPAGWIIKSLNWLDNSVQFVIQKLGAMPESPLHIGTAVFMPQKPAVATTIVNLESISITTNDKVIPLCLKSTEGTIWSVSIVSTLGIDKNKYQSSSFSVYPNPASNTIRLSIPIGSLQGVQVYDVMGRRVALTPAPLPPGEGFEFDVRGLPEGLYYLRIGQASARFEILR